MNYARESDSWLSRYGTGFYAWRTAGLGGARWFERRIGLTETSFDNDGRYYGGRADMSALLTVHVHHTLSKDAFRERVALAWANLRLRHVMLMSRAAYDNQAQQRNFVVDLHDTLADTLSDAMKSIVWVEDFHEEVDEDELYHHGLNVGRLIEPETCLSKLYILPLVYSPDGTYELRFLVAMAHQISDGLTAYNWFSDFLRILNLPKTGLKDEINVGLNEEGLKNRLPPAQEDLYPSIHGNKARERWFWAIIRVLRHLRKSNPQSFVNPLRTTNTTKESAMLPSTFDGIFDYSDARRPPLRSGSICARLSAHSSKRLVELCRSIKVSIGAGCFALCGLAMMAIEEEQNPNISIGERLPFAAGFPLNPRAFFGLKNSADSCMLAFSEGVIMPFLPSSIPVEKRLLILARHTNRQLRTYQKRGKESSVRIQNTLDPHAPARLLANAYLGAIERSNAGLPADHRWAVSPQNSLQPSAIRHKATCGVSSIGSTAAWLAAGKYDLQDVATDAQDGTSDFAADFRSLKQGVRARDNEFLTSCSSDAEGIMHFSVSYDASGVPQEMADKWKSVIEGLLEGNR